MFKKKYSISLQELVNTQNIKMKASLIMSHCWGFNRLLTLDSTAKGNAYETPNTIYLHTIRMANKKW